MTNSFPTLSNPNLYQALQALDLDLPDVALSFTERLAVENSWTVNHAQTVLDEYRRFLYLLALGKHPVCPSDAVDQAWHLHLLYTRSYWQDLCNNIIGRPLHHEPTQGGVAEREKFMQWYKQTLDTYQHEFNIPAPSLVWPKPEQRFAPEVLHQRLRIHDYKILTLKDYMTYKTIVSVIIGLLGWMLTGSVLTSLLGIVYFVVVELVYEKQCIHCHRNHALKLVTATKLCTNKIPIMLFKCRYCGNTEWRGNKNLSNDSNAACGGGGCGSGCGGGCGGGGCGG